MPQIAARHPARARILPQEPTKSKFFRFDEPVPAGFLHEKLRGQKHLAGAQISASDRERRNAAEQHAVEKNLVNGGDDPRPHRPQDQRSEA
jgi:hypothetical protein